MRVLLTSYSEKTQFLPMIPLGWALRAAGHDVLFATQPEHADTVADSGLTTTVVGNDSRIYRLLDHARSSGDSTVSDLDLAAAAATPDLDPQTLVTTYDDHAQWWWRAANDPMIADMVAVCRSWKPDLVVWEAVTFAGAVAAEAVGVPHVRFLWTADVFAVVRRRYLQARATELVNSPDRLAQWLGSRLRSYGCEFTERVVTGHATITFLPPSLRWPVGSATADPDHRYIGMKFVPYHGRTVLERWLLDPPPRDRVCVSLGISAVERFGGFVIPVEAVLQGLAEFDFEVIATIPDGQRPPKHRVPGNVRFEAFPPLDALAPTCVLVVDHAGPGTLCTVLGHGVPQLLVPEEFDAPLLADLYGRTGAGLTLAHTEVSADVVAGAVENLLSNSDFRRSAAALAAENERMPGTADVVRELERMIRPVSVALESSDLARLGTVDTVDGA